MEPAGSQRAIGSLPVPRGRRRLLSSLAWKLYGALHLWLRPFLASCLSSSHNRQLPALPVHLQPFCPAGSSRPPTKANPERTHRLSASLCLLLFLLLLLRDLSSFASTLRRKSHIPGGMAEPHGAETGDTAGSLSLPVLGAGAGDRQRCLARPGARDVPGRGGQARWVMLSLMLVVQPCLCPSLAPAALPTVTSCLSTVLFISPAFFSFFFPPPPLSEYTLCAVRPGSSLSCWLGSSCWVVDPWGGAGWGGLCVSPRGRL